MGYQINNVCYENSTQALYGFRSTMPIFGGDDDEDMGLYYISASSTNATGLITYAIKASDGTTQISSGRIQLPLCDYDLYGSTSYPVQSLMLVIAFFLILFLGFKTGFKP